MADAGSPDGGSSRPVPLCQTSGDGKGHLSVSAYSELPNLPTPLSARQKGNVQRPAAGTVLEARGQAIVVLGVDPCLPLASSLAEGTWPL